MSRRRRGAPEFLKIGVRNAMVIAVASCALVVDRERRTLACALGAVGPVPVRDHDAELWATTRLDWDAAGPPHPSVVEGFARRMAAASRPIDDHRATADYRRHAVEVMARRALERRLGAGGMTRRHGTRVVDAVYELTVNGQPRQVSGAHAGDSLLHVLRDRPGCPGEERLRAGRVRFVLGAGRRGAGVRLPRAGRGRGRLRDHHRRGPGARGAEPGDAALAGDVLTDVQQAMVEAGGVQCGFCTPGFVVAIHDLLDRVPEPTTLEVREALAGNLCRCTGYGRILAAVDQVVAVRTGRSS